MDPKLTLLVLLIAGVIALSHLGEGTLDRIRRQSAVRRWRELRPGRRRV